MHVTRSGAFAIAISAALAMSGAALAQSRPSTTAMTCAQAQSTVRSAGSILLGTGGFSYDRFVRDSSFCTAQEIAIPTWAPTRDNAQCMVGNVCELRAGREPTPP